VKRALAVVLVLAAVGAGSAGAAPPKTSSLPVAVQSSLAFGGLQGGKGDVVLGLQGTLDVVAISPQLVFVTGGELTGKGASGAAYSFGNAFGVLSPLGSVLFFVARVTAPSAAEQALQQAAADATKQADVHRTAAAQLEAEAAQLAADAESLREEAKREREEADRLTAQAAADEAAAADLERPIRNCVTPSVKPGSQLIVAALRPC
jgi:hypothetical protein